MSKYSNEQPFLFKDYADMRSNLSDRDIYNPNSPQREESEFKKPYLANEYPESENLYQPPGGFRPNPPWVPPGPGGDCTPTGDAVGGGPNLCDPGLDCGQWIYTCAHKIVSFQAIGGVIKSIRYQSNDVAVVTACWGPDRKQLAIKALFDNGKLVSSGFNKEDCLGPGKDPTCVTCVDCSQALHPPILHAITLQMSINGTQALWATGGSGAPYKWSITAGGGSLSTTLTISGEKLTYTAPSSNANCANNPTIQVKDYCDHTATLQIAINGYSPATATAGSFTKFVTTGGGGSGCSATGINLKAFSCVGTQSDAWPACYNCCFKAGVGCIVYDGYTCGSSAGFECTQANLVARCQADDPYGCATNSECEIELRDTRSGAQIAGGCCPYELLAGWTP